MEKIYANWSASRTALIQRWEAMYGAFPDLIEVSKFTYQLIYCLYLAKGNIGVGNFMDWQVDIEYFPGLENDEIILSDASGGLMLLKGGEILEYD